jgi:hypothetical protein
LRREEIKLQVGLITPLLHVSGYAAPETSAAVERARLLIEQAEALGDRSGTGQYFSVHMEYRIAENGQLVVTQIPET